MGIGGGSESEWVAEGDVRRVMGVCMWMQLMCVRERDRERVCVCV